jgi:hypothetical protein
MFWFLCSFARNRSVLFMPLRVAGVIRQKPFCALYATVRGGRYSPETVLCSLCHCAWRALFARNRSVLFMPLRVAGVIRQKPFRALYATARGGRYSPETVLCSLCHCAWRALFARNRSDRFPAPSCGQALRPAPIMIVGGSLTSVGYASAAVNWR